MPSDFEVQASTGAIPEWMGSSEYVHLRANGHGEFRAWQVGMGTLTDSSRFVIPSERMAGVWRTIRSNQFFGIASHHVNRRVFDGGYLALWVVAHGDTHQVRVDNDYVPSVRRIFEAINDVTPKQATLHYEDIGRHRGWWPPWER